MPRFENTIEPSPAPSVSDVDAVSRLADDLQAARFRTDALDELLGPVARDALARERPLAATRVLSGHDSALATLARFFLLSQPVDEASLDVALPTVTAAGAIALNLARKRDDGTLVASVDLRPVTVVDGLGVAEWWIASDLGEGARVAQGLPRELPENHVLGVGGASLTLMGITLSTPVARALDLGTGCGIQALHLARFAETVVATDISARALEFAAFNAALNSVRGIEWRHGSLYEPVAGERFDLVVSNPPFVITPRAAGVPDYEYRDAGLTGDALVRDVVHGAADALNPGGRAQLLGNWEYRADRSGVERVLEWAAEAGLGIWVVERDRHDPAQYAELWIRDGGTSSAAVLDELQGHWLDDFAARGVTDIGMGMIVLTAPRDPVGTGERLSRGEELAGGSPGALAAAFAAGLDADERTAHLDATALAAQSFRVADDVTEERHLIPGAEHPTVILLRQGGGFARVIPVSPAIAAIVGACDGSIPLGVLVTAVAGLLDEDPDALAVEADHRVRELLVGGILA